MGHLTNSLLEKVQSQARHFLYHKVNAQIIYNGTLVIKSDDPVMPERRINLLGRGSDNICPQARVAVDEQV